MIIVANQIYRQDDKCFRILWTDVRNNLVVWIAIEDKKGVPELMSFEAMMSLVGDDVVTESDHDPYSDWPLEVIFFGDRKEQMGCELADD